MSGWRAKETWGGHAFCRNPSQGFIFGFASSASAVEWTWRHASGGFFISCRFTASVSKSTTAYLTVLKIDKEGNRRNLKGSSQRSSSGRLRQGMGSLILELGPIPHGCLQYPQFFDAVVLHSTCRTRARAGEGQYGGGGATCSQVLPACQTQQRQSNVSSSLASEQTTLPSTTRDRSRRTSEKALLHHVAYILCQCRYVVSGCRWELI